MTSADVRVTRFLEFDTATIYEAAGHRGMVDPTIRPAWPGAVICGVALTTECVAGDNLMLHHAVAAATPGTVIVARVGEYLLKGGWGEVLTVAAQARGVVGLAVDGAVRDIDAIAKLQFPVFCRGLGIGACVKRHIGPLGEPIVFGGAVVRTGDIIVGNGDGMVVIASETADEVYAEATVRRDKEADMMAQLRLGKTTLELLGLAALPKK